MMFNKYESKYIFDLTYIGNLVKLNTLAGLSGKVIASFERTFYISVLGHILCVACSGVNRGPNVLNSSASEQIDWTASGVKAGDHVRISADCMYLRNFVFNASGAKLWLPSKPKVELLPDVVKKGLSCIKKRKRNSGFEGAILALSFYPMISLQAWLIEGFRKPYMEAKPLSFGVASLIGLGPGLTPSGDDFLGGVMITLSQLGRNDMCSKVWDLVSKQSVDMTGSISRSHLWAASQGFGSELFHRLLTALFNGEQNSIVSVLKEIDSYGSTSGWDTVSGFGMALETWVNSQINYSKVA